MILKKPIRTKQGSYIVEAALTLPLLILCIVALALIINIIALCENIGFITAKEMHRIDIDAYQKIQSVSLCKHSVKSSVLRNNPSLSDFKVTSFKHLFERGEIKDLIAISTQADFTVENPVGIYGKIRFTEKLMSRGFTGNLKPVDPLTAQEFMKNQGSEPVVVFPKYGIRFHKSNCRYVKSNYRGEEYRLEMEEEDAKGKGYTPCLVCGGAAYG